MAKQTKTKTAKQPEAAIVGATATNKDSGFSFRSFKVQAVLLAIICIVFYANTFQHEAAFDDRMAITDNEYVQAGTAGIADILTRDAYQSYLEHRQGGNQLAGGRYRPLSLITFAIEQQIMGTDHAGETSADRDKRVASEMHARHVVNVLLYALACIALLWLLRTVVFPENAVAAFAATLIFAIHPLHTEVVANVKSRDEILSVLFVSLTLVKGFRYFDTRKTGELAWTLLFYFLALLSKEYGVTLLALLPLSFCVFRNVTPSASLKASLPLLIPFGLYLALRFASYSGVAEGAEANIMNNPYLLATGAQKLASELLVLLRYLGLLFFPHVLAADYSYNQLPYTSFANPLVWLSVALYAGLVVAMVRQALKRHILGFALALFLANLFLVSNLLFNIGAPMGERLVFHSSIGFAIVIAWLLVKGLERLKAPATNFALPGILIVLVLCSAFKTMDRNKAWKNDETLFLTDVKTVPNSVLVNNNAAAACMAEAKKNKENVPVRNEWFTKAIGYFSKALAIYPGHTIARMNRGLCYYNMGEPDKALPDWDSVRRQEPNKPELSKYLATASAYFYNKGLNYGKTNQPDSAIYAFEKSAEASPERAEPWYYLASAYYAVGRAGDAQRSLVKALSIAPKYPEALRLQEAMKSATPVGGR